MGNKLIRLSNMLGPLLRARGMQARLSEYRIFGQWERTVGAVIAAHARPQCVRGSKLFLTVDSPAWMQQLSLLKPDIIAKVNRGLGRDAIRDIGLNLGEVPALQNRPVRSMQFELSREEQARIENVVEEIRDPDVRHALRRVMEKDVLRKKGNRG